MKLKNASPLPVLYFFVHSFVKLNEYKLYIEILLLIFMLDSIFIWTKDYTFIEQL